MPSVSKTQILKPEYAVYQNMLDNTQISQKSENMLDMYINKVNEQKPNNLIDNGGESVIIKEGKTKLITKITDNAINNVPKAEVIGYNDNQHTYIQEQHKELLKYARDNNDNKEVAFVFRKDLTDMKIVEGDESTIDVTNAIVGKGEGVFVIHNHPNNSSYSDRDIRLLISNDNVSVLSIVKNNGGIETLQKSAKYNSKIAKTELIRKIKKYVKNNTSEEMDKAIREFLKNNKEMFIWKTM